MGPKMEVSWEKFALYILETVQDIATVTMEH